MESSRAELFRLLGDDTRLKILALCADEELTVGELATLLDDSQSQMTKKTQPLREAGLLMARREGTRTWLRWRPTPEPAMHAMFELALQEGRALCNADGSLAKLAAVVTQREESSRNYFAAVPHGVRIPDSSASLGYLAAFAPLLGRTSLALDLGTGDGQLLPVLAQLFERVIAVDRSPARLAHCAAVLESHGLGNVRLRHGDAADVNLIEEIDSKGGADLVVMMRVLHHMARPGDATRAAARMLRPGGHLLLIDYLPHHDEALREQGHIWLGFTAERLSEFLRQAGLAVKATTELPRHITSLPMHMGLGHKVP